VARPDVDALLTPPGDTAALAAALKRVLEDAELADTLRLSGSARAEVFSMRSLALQYVDRYEALVAERALAAASGRTGARVPRWVRRIMTPS
jgi:glycosyltransferase involved in cell wall biosynthesis